MERESADPALTQAVLEQLHTNFLDVAQALSPDDDLKVPDNHPMKMYVPLDYLGTNHNVTRVKKMLLNEVTPSKPYITEHKRKLASGNQRTETIFISYNGAIMQESSSVNFKPLILPVATKTQYRFITFDKESTRAKPRVEIAFFPEEEFLTAISEYKENFFESHIKATDIMLRKDFKLKRLQRKARYERLPD